MYCDFPDLGRCCFCLPLRRGVIAFGYLNLLFGAFMIGLYSYLFSHGMSKPVLIYHGTVATRSYELCIALYCIEVVLAMVLLYGAHMESVIYIRVYYYFAITTIIAALFVQILEIIMSSDGQRDIETMPLTFCGFCIQLYLIMLIRSLLKKLETSGNHVYENQLQQFVSGETRVEANGVYNNTTVVPEDV